MEEAFPDVVPSAQEVDQEEYDNLRKSFLLPRVEHNVELPYEPALCKTIKPPLIDGDQPGLIVTKKRIAQLTDVNGHVEIY